MENKVQTGFLFARPTFAAGAAFVLDLWGQFPGYNDSASAAEADRNALAADWCVVGQDIVEAADQLMQTSNGL